MPVLAPLANRVLVRLWGIRNLALSNFIVAARCRRQRSDDPAAERVGRSFRRETKRATSRRSSRARREMGRGTELIFVEGHSSDDTYAAIERAIAANPQRPRQAAAPDRPRQRRRGAARLRGGDAATS